MQEWRNKLFVELVDYWEQVGPIYCACKSLGIDKTDIFLDTTITGTLLNRIAQITLQNDNLDDRLKLGLVVMASLRKSLIEDKLSTKVKDLIARL